MGRRLVEDGEGQILQLFFDLTNLSDQQGTVVADYCRCGLLWLGGGRSARDVLSCKESVDFSFQKPHSFSQYMGFGR